MKKVIFLLSIIMFFFKTSANANYEKKIYADRNNTVFSSILIGMAFAFGWTPCIGPILGSILILASTTENIGKGILLLSSYSLGLAIPFILSGYLIQKFILLSKNIRKKMNVITKVGGILLFLTGILILTNQLQVLHLDPLLGLEQLRLDIVLALLEKILQKLLQQIVVQLLHN